MNGFFDVAAIAWLVACLLTSLLVSGLALRYGRWRRLIDQPGERRSHAVPTPRGGGLGIVAGFLLAMGLLALWQPERRPFLIWSAAGLSLVAAIGWIDDHRPLSPWLRLVVQGVAAALLGAAVWMATGHAIAAAALAAAALVLVNVWNFMDGIDGIATLQGIVVALTAAMLAAAAPASWLALALGAACIGFLPLNFPRARVFLGDVGSGALGYGLAVLAAALALEARGGWLPASLLLLPASAFLLDASLTLASRILCGQRWWTPHVEHAYQRSARSIGRHAPVTWGFTAWSLGGAVFAVSIAGRGVRFIIAAGAAWYLVGLVAWCVVKRRTGGFDARI